MFSPEVSPSSITTAATGGNRRHRTGTGTGTTSTQRPARRRRRADCDSPPPFNLNTISRGVSTSDFYLAVPTAIVRFLESDTNTKSSPSRSCAAPKARKLTLNLGQRIPVISTSYTPIATGGAGVNPLELVSVPGRRREHRHDADA